MRLVVNTKTDCVGNIKEKDAFYFVITTLTKNGYRVVKNAETIKEVVFEKNTLCYNVKLTEWYLNLENYVVLDVIELIVNTDFDNEYLNREIIPCHYCIDNDKVLIDNEHTLYVNETRKYVSLSETLNLYKEVLKIAKQKGIKVSYSNHYKKQLTDLTALYNESIELSHRIFDKLVEVAYVIENRKIHLGSRDDIRLNELSKIKYEYEKLFYSSATLGRILNIQYQLQDIHSNITWSDNMVKIFL